MPKSVRPLGKRVVVIPKEMEKVTDSGIIIADTASGEMPQEGSVIAIGDEITTIKVGDTVLFPKYAGDDIQVEKRDIKILWLDSVLGVIEDTKDGKLQNTPKKHPKKTGSDKKSLNRKKSKA